jgi:hypothetical protein
VPPSAQQAGFTDGEGCWDVNIRKSTKYKIGTQITLKFSLAQHSRDHLLIKSLVQYFGCGVYSKSFTQGLMSKFIVAKFKDLEEKIIPFF